MTLTYQQIQQALQGCNLIFNANESVSGELSLKLARLARELEGHQNDFQKARKPLIEKYTDDRGQPAGDEAEAALQEEVSELLQEEVEVNGLAIDAGLIEAQETMPPAAIMLLEPLIVDETRQSAAPQGPSI